MSKPNAPILLPSEDVAPGIFTEAERARLRAASRRKNTSALAAGRSIKNQYRKIWTVGKLGEPNCRPTK